MIQEILKSGQLPKINYWHITSTSRERFKHFFGFHTWWTTTSISDSSWGKMCIVCKKQIIVGKSQLVEITKFTYSEGE